VQTPVSQQPQSQVAQQQGLQFAGQAPPQQAAWPVAGAKSAAMSRTKYNMEILLRNLTE
jgi:hypothetical protein